MGFLFIKGISYEQNEVVLSTSTNNLNLCERGFNFLENTSAGPINLTGVAATTENNDPYNTDYIYQKRLMNTGTQDIVLKHDDVNSDVGNRFFNKSGADIILSPGDMVEYYWINRGIYNGWYEEA